MANPNIRIRRSSVPGKRPTIEQLSSGELALNTHDGEIFVRRERSGIGTDIVTVSAGATVTNIIYVTKDGKDTNTGLRLGDAKASIKDAVENAAEGSVIKVSAGVYEENNPITLPKQVSIVGESLREVSVKPLNDNDLFRVSTGNYIANMSFIGISSSSNMGVIAFNPDKPAYIDQSPYIQNCTNFIENSIGLKIDGRHAIGPLKSMVLDSFTQYNPNGIGVSITNSAYAQLVSLFTICPDKAVYCGSGGACDLTNSNSSFGNYGLIADGVSSLQYTGSSVYEKTAPFSEFVVDFTQNILNVVDAQYDRTSGLTTITVDAEHNFNVGMAVTITGLEFTCPTEGVGISTFPSGNNGYVFNVVSMGSTNSFQTYVGVSTLQHTYVSGGVVSPYIVRPFDGQVLYVDRLYYEIEEVRVSYGGSGYSTPPSVSFQSPSTNWGVPAQAIAEVANGSITNINLVSSGRGYTTVPAITISPPTTGSNFASVEVIIKPKYYLVSDSTPITGGSTTITLTDNIPYNVGAGSTVYFFKQSRLLASGHAFEYIGSGTDIDYAIPFNGGVPIQKNETVSTNGGLVVYTSTDQSGNFRVGDGVVINQASGTISGTFYSKSLFSTMTPFILALGGD